MIDEDTLELPGKKEKVRRCFIRERPLPPPFYGRARVEKLRKWRKFEEWMKSLSPAPLLLPEELSRERLYEPESND